MGFIDTGSLAFRRRQGKLAEYPHDQTGPLFRSSRQFDYSGIIARFLPFVADLHHVNFAWLFGPDGHVDELGDIGLKCLDLPGNREVRNKPDLIPEFLSRLASEPDNMAGLDFNERLTVTLHGQNHLGMVRVIEKHLGFFRKLPEHRERGDGQLDAALSAGRDTAVGVGRGAGAIGVDILDLQEGVADILDGEGVRQFTVFKNFAEIKGGLGDLGFGPKVAIAASGAPSSNNIKIKAR